MVTPLPGAEDGVQRLVPLNGQSCPIAKGVALHREFAGKQHNFAEEGIYARNLAGAAGAARGGAARQTQAQGGAQLFQLAAVLLVGRSRGEGCGGETRPSEAAKDA